MGYNGRVLKVISIVQIIMSGIFLALGIADRYEARFVYTSYLFSPCWIAALVLPAGIMGVILVNKSSPSSTLINALSSVSMTTTIVSGMTVLKYQFAVRRIVDENLFVTNIKDWMSYEAHFAKKDAPLELTDQENTSIAISSLVVIFSAIEIALAVCVALNSDSPYQRPQGRQIIQEGNVYNQFTAEPLQPIYTAAQPSFVIPVSNNSGYQ